MSAETYTQFKLVNPHYGDDQYMNLLETNMEQWLNWAFLGIGAWTDAEVPQVGAYGGDISRLRPAHHAAYTDGQVWEGARKDWVWETGVNYIDSEGDTQNPEPVGTPQVNGSPSAAAHHVDYRNGRIIFDTAIPTSSTVKLTHSYRSVQVYQANACPWYQELQYRSLRNESAQFTQEASGNWSVSPNHRIQMPCIVVGVVPSVSASHTRGDTRGYQLGNGKLWINQDIMFHVFSENRSERNNLCSTLIAQTDKTIWLFDSNAVAAAEAYPIDYRGELTGSIQYPDLVSETGYRWRRCRFARGFGEESQTLNPNLYEGRVRLLAEFDH